jgi:acetyl esterase/lipase
MPWTGVRDALEFGPSRPANRRPADRRRLPASQRLDAGLRDNRKRPVMVWFHGGAYSSGTSNEIETDGERLSRKGDVVVVTVNHRSTHLAISTSPSSVAELVDRATPAARSDPRARVGARQHRGIRRRSPAT